jgi:hypothetical protein
MTNAKPTKDTTMTQAAHMTKDEFFTWMAFFRGAEVVIGKGKTSWTLKGGWFDNARNRPVVRLERNYKVYANLMHAKYTIDANRIRLHKLSL